MTSPRPLVGIALFLFSPKHHPSKFLLGKRLSSHGANTYALPGGHLEHTETFEFCAAREALEETGLTVDPSSLKFFTATNDVMEEGKHYVTIFMTGRVGEEDERLGREPKTMEPDKCEGWQWFSWEEMLAIQRERGVAEWTMMAAGNRAEEGKDDGQAEGKEGRRLFQPLRNLIFTRPGLVPGAEG